MLPRVHCILELIESGIMAIEITGTNGNDVLQPFGNGLVLTVSGTIAQGIWPTFNVVVNGVTVMSNVSVTANHAVGATQVVNVPIPAGMAVSSLSIQYTNDAQTSYATEDRNLYISSVVLNGHTLPTSAASYERTGGTTVTGQDAMVWGGSLNWSGSIVTSAGASISGDVNVSALAGIDTLVLPGLHTDYTLSHVGSAWTATHHGGGEVINMNSVERLNFSDVKVAIDMDGHAGFTAGLISALFGASTLNNPYFVTAGLTLLDGGMSQVQLADRAIHTAEFQALVGSTTNTAFVNLVYTHVVGSAPPPAELSYFVNLLDSGQFTQASLAVQAANCPPNQVHLVGVDDTGIIFA
jgi:hypothetical protein